MSTNSEKLAKVWAQVVKDAGWLRAQVPLVQAHWGAFVVVFGAGFVLGAVLV